MAASIEIIEPLDTVSSVNSWIAKHIGLALNLQTLNMAIEDIK